MTSLAHIIARTLANALIAMLMLFLIHRYLMFWHDWPTLVEAYQQFSSDNNASKHPALSLLFAYGATFAIVIWRSVVSQSNSLMIDANRYANWTAYLIRFAFWGVFLIGLVDTAISAMRIEGAFIALFGASMDTKIGLAKFRGLYVHYPLLVISAIIAAFTRNLSFIWLALLVVLAEFMVVITRFVFSYEQSYMGDLVRFWYAALFLFASAYTLIEEGHVRVDVIYAGLKKRSKSWVNALGSLFLGIPFCMTILLTGMDSKQSSLASPIINFEISQSGYGMFVKYLMAGFLIIFAVSMMIQFISYFLSNSAVLLGDEQAPKPQQGGH